MSALKNLKGSKTVERISFQGRYDPNDQDYYRNFVNALAFPHTKYVYLFCGLYNRSLLVQIFPQLNAVYAVDRYFIIFLSMIAPILYVHKYLYFRDTHEIQYSNEANYFTWKNEMVGLKKLIRAIVKSPNIKWYRKLYVPVAIFMLCNRVTMLFLIRLIGYLFKFTIFIPKQLEKLQIFIAHRYY